MKIFLNVFSILLLLNFRFAAIYGGWMLISDPDGSKFGWRIEIIAGITSVVIGIILLKKYKINYGTTE